MIGIYDCFGYGGSYNVPFGERYKLIKSAGFDCVMLWWSDKFGRGMEFRQDAELARNAGLKIENIHAPVHEQNCLSFDNLDGDSVCQAYLQCVDDCVYFNIPTMVIHLPDDSHPITELGLKRIEQITYKAEKESIKIAFENLDNINNLDFVFKKFPTQSVGFCYDSCHHKNYASNTDLLNKYSNRLMALHLHDNGGKNNQHQLPFDGDIDWKDVMNKIALTGYQGATTLEPMNWDYENLSVTDFLACAYQAAEKLEALRSL